MCVSVSLSVSVQERKRVARTSLGLIPLFVCFPFFVPWIIYLPNNTVRRSTVFEITPLLTKWRERDHRTVCTCIINRSRRGWFLQINHNHNHRERGVFVVVCWCKCSWQLHSSWCDQQLQPYSCWSSSSNQTTTRRRRWRGILVVIIAAVAVTVRRILMILMMMILILMWMMDLLLHHSCIVIVLLLQMEWRETIV